MRRYIAKRLMMLIPVLLGVSFIVYFITDLAPGDVVDMMITPEMTKEDIEQLREDLGLNEPVVYRYLKYLWGMLHGDLGESYFTGEPVLNSYIKRFPNTLLLASCSALIATVVSLIAGIYSAKHRGTLADTGTMVAVLLIMSMPGFFIGLLLLIVFSLNLHWLPSSGNEGWQSIIMPAFASAAASLALLTRTTRSAMLDALSMDYLDLARSKGVGEKFVVNRHALKNALIPIVTVVGSEFAALLGGSTIVEKLFAWPGVGAFVIDAVGNRDIPIVCGFITLTTALITIVQLGVDIMYAYIDPRIKAKYVKQAAKVKKTKKAVSVNG